MKPTIQGKDRAFFDKLTLQTRRIIEALASSTLARQALSQTEEEHIKVRRALRSRYEEIGKEKLEEASQLAAVIPSMQVQFARSEDEYIKAKKRLAESQLRCGLLHDDVQRLRLGIARELMAGADERIKDYLFHMSQIRDVRLPMALSLWLLPKTRELRSNTDDMAAANEAVMDAHSSAVELLLEPLGFDQVTEALKAINMKLAPVLERVELNPPCILSADGRVLEPLPFMGNGGKSRWLLDDAQDPATDEHRKADLKAQAARVNKSAQVVERSNIENLSA